MEELICCTNKIVGHNNFFMLQFAVADIYRYPLDEAGVCGSA
jgi:hypothetical protein